jgi:hypothetical protein
VRSHRRNSGQIIVMFALLLVPIIGGVGLVIDVGGAWGQQRSEQKIADTAALAGATAETNGATKGGIVDAAWANACLNLTSNPNASPCTLPTGYSVTVNIPPKSGAYAPGGSQSGPLSTNDCSTPALEPCWIEVVINGPHVNYFAAVFPGQGSWNVSTRGVAVGGIANGANGVAPMEFSYLAVKTGNKTNYCNPQGNKCGQHGDTWPVTGTQFNWTQFCIQSPNNCNVDTARIKAIINGDSIIYGVSLQDLVVYLGMYLGPNNSGQHTDACTLLVKTYPNGADLPVAVVDQNGNLVGFWMWHFDAADTNCNGPDGEVLAGYFLDPGTPSLPLTISALGSKAAFGEYVVRLVE